mmetsp:Transcript_7498/g.19571  ORF Transcript_7498/g.19571 Transcript_7498/m.19571 type:complete len:207 (-) Transcript_7498:1215-1835(-)
MHRAVLAAASAPLMCSPRTAAATLKKGACTSQPRSRSAEPYAWQAAFATPSSLAHAAMTRSHSCTGTSSPPSSSSSRIFSTYQPTLGACLSARFAISVRILERISFASMPLRWFKSVRYALIFSTTTSTFCCVVIAASRSNVLRRIVSSLSSRQSTTAIWCSCAYDGFTRVMCMSESMPTYLRLRCLERSSADVLCAANVSSSVDG